MHDLPDEIRDWEPAHTLTDQSEDGLGLVRRTVEEAPAWLRAQRLGADGDRPRSGPGRQRVMTRGGFRDVATTKGGPIPITRVIAGKRPR